MHVPVDDTVVNVQLAVDDKRPQHVDRVRERRLLQRSVVRALVAFVVVHVWIDQRRDQVGWLDCKAVAVVDLLRVCSNKIVRLLVVQLEPATNRLLCGVSSAYLRDVRGGCVGDGVECVRGGTLYRR